MTAEQATSHVTFRLLGPLTIHSADGPDGQNGTEKSAVAVAGAAERALLALLLLAPGRMVTSAALIDRLWGEEELPADPANALQLRVSKLRRALAGTDAAVVRDGVGYRIDVVPGDVDVEAFTTAVRAARDLRGATPAPGSPTLDPQRALEAAATYRDGLDLWAGEPLADFADRPWAMVEAARLTQLRTAALTERAQLLLALGRPDDVVADLDPVVATDPTQETLAGLLMTGLYQVGQQAAALDVYERTRRRLDDDLGLEPSAALRTLHQKVLAQDPTLAPAEPVVAGPGPAATTARPASTAPAAPATAAVTPTAGPVTNVPMPPHALLGRRDELDTLADLLTSSRLVSLVGPGGSGKTTTAYTAARHAVEQRSEQFPDGAWAVRLAPVTSSDQVPLAAAEAVGAPLAGAAGGQPAGERLLAYLRPRRLLLVLDNCEHVIDGAARMADEVLAACPGVTILATSREALAVPGEVQVPLGPLATPPDGTAPEQVLGYPAARLFADRAHAVRPALDLTAPDQLSAVAQVVTALDGMPLAVELAAARVTTLTPPELATRLADRFRLLTSGARTADARQRTLRATVDWSHELLTDAEQAVFRRLAVFHGGWTLDAAETVTADADLPVGEVLDLLTRLVDRHMVVVDTGLVGSSRYRMLETLRQYAAEKLAASGEADLMASRHVAYLRALVDECETTLRGPRQLPTVLRLRDELPNLRAAFGWLADREDAAAVDDALHLAGGLGWFWHFGRHVEGRDLLRQVAALPGGSPQARARALQAVSLVERPRSCPVHPSPRCAETAQESLDLFEKLGDPQRAAVSRVLLAVEGVAATAANGRDELAARSRQLLADADARFDADDDSWGHALAGFVRMETYLKTGDPTRAIPTGRAAAAAFRALNDPWGLSAVLYHLGWGLRQFGRYAESVPVLEEAIDVATRGGIQNTALWAQADLAIAFVHLGDLGAARASFDAADAGSVDTGDGAGHVLATYGHGLLARIAGDNAAARGHYEAALAGFETLGTPVPAGLAVAGLARCDEVDEDLESARTRYEQVRNLGETAGEPALVGCGLDGLARIAARQGKRSDAEHKLATSDAVRAAGVRPRTPFERAELAEAGLSSAADT
jgi:predicted ATPase/DNA-binding SARP family transcriptional activator